MIGEGGFSQRMFLQVREICEITKRRFEQELADVVKSKPLDEFEGVKG